jgi:hypothetical protein
MLGTKKHTFMTNQSAVFPTIHQTTEIRQKTVVEPSHVKVCRLDDGLGYMMYRQGFRVQDFRLLDHSLGLKVYALEFMI